ncbi:MAG TPA: aspartate aminotransferase family protein [Lentimicrobium sp.]|nr:aspartate aminotransferase family protein [Lentimicrobium sp.]
MNDYFTLPDKGMTSEDILALLEQCKKSDAKWQNGRMFGYVYSPETKAVELMTKVNELYLFENALNTSLFPSIAQGEIQIVSIAARLLNGDASVAGSVTSGGTESILLAMKACREYIHKQKPTLKDPEVILPWSVHPAFHKAAQLLGIKAILLPLQNDYRADCNALVRLINEKTILIVGSAPSYSHGVVDPIEEMGKIALERNLFFHVDSCLGGFFLPFMEKLDYKIPLFDFRIPGVTSISADMHKFGYGAKGASVILYRTKELWRSQFFVHCDWPGGLFGCTTFLGSRSGAPIMDALAMLMFHGMEGYMALTNKTMKAVEKLKSGICAIEGLSIVGEPVMCVLAFSSSKKDIYLIGDELHNRGWYIDRIMYPEALHLIITNPNLENTDRFLTDLQQCVKAVRHNTLKRVSAGVGIKLGKKLMTAFPGKTSKLLGLKASGSVDTKQSTGGKSSASFYGIASSIENKTNLNDIVLNYLERTHTAK